MVIAQGLDNPALCRPHPARRQTCPGNKAPRPRKKQTFTTSFAKLSRRSTAYGHLDWIKQLTCGTSTLEACPHSHPRNKHGLIIFIDIDRVVSIKGLVIRTTPIIPDMRDGELPYHMSCIMQLTMSSILPVFRLQPYNNCRNQ